MFGRKYFLVTSPPHAPNPLEPILPIPPLPPGSTTRTFGVWFFDPIADNSGVWLCGPYSSDRIQWGQGAFNKPWAIWLHPTGKSHRVFMLDMDSSVYGGGRLLNRGKLDLLFATNVPHEPGQPLQRDPPLEALHLRTLDPASGIVHQDTFSAQRGSDISKVQFPFNELGNLYAGTYSPHDGYALRQIVDMSWPIAWTAPALQLPPGWEPGTFSSLQLACQPTLSPDGAWVMAFSTRYRSVSGATKRRIVAICSIRGLQTSWSTVLCDPQYDIESVSVDVDYSGEIYAALVLRNPPGLGQVVTHKLDVTGSIQPGWPRSLTSGEGLSKAQIRVGARDVFVAGIVGTGLASPRPFVASYKRDGTPTTLFGRDFRANTREEWHRCGIAVLDEDFFLTGYTITLDSSDPEKQEHALQAAKFDRYGVLI